MWRYRISLTRYLMTLLSIIHRMNDWEIEFAFGDIFAKALNLRMLKTAQLFSNILKFILVDLRIPFPIPSYNSHRVCDNTMPIEQLVEISLCRCH